MPPKTKRKNGSIGKRERRALGIPSPVGQEIVEAGPAPLDIDIDTS